MAYAYTGFTFQQNCFWTDDNKTMLQNYLESRCNIDISLLIKRGLN